MNDLPEIQKRINSLRTELEQLSAYHKRIGLADHWISVWLMIITLASSIGAGIGGIFMNFSSQATGGLALLPGLMAIVASNLKFQGKSNWHFRKTEAVDGLMHKLIYELPLNPTAQDIATVSAALTKTKQDFLKEWEKAFQHNWDNFHGVDKRTGNVGDDRHHV
jgi:hypothetical protein